MDLSIFLFILFKLSKLKPNDRKDINMFGSKNFWCKDDKKLNVNSQVADLYAELKEKIIQKMTQNLWINDKDYYFGISEINDYPVVYYKNIGDRTSILYHDLRNSTRSAVQESIGYNIVQDEILKAFGINVFICYNKDNPEIGCNVLCEEELEKAIKEEPDRWQFYLDHKNDE